MKAVSIVAIVAWGTAVGGADADTVYYARAYTDPSRLMADLARYDFDVADAAGEYFGLIASAEDLAALEREGISYDIVKVIDTADAPPSEYTEYDEMVPMLQNLAKTYPNICALYDIGDTWEKREIWALKISDNVTTHEAAEKDILIDGNHHAREIMTVEVPLHLAKQLCEKYPADPDVKSIVENVETWIIPMLNPDGHNHVFKVYNMWRKNRRDNGGGIYGVDLNRNYDYQWGKVPGCSHDPNASTYCGPYAFSEPEMVAVRNLLNDAAHQFRYALNYHSSGRYCIYPWNHDYGHPPEPDYTYFKNVSAYLLETLSGWRHGNFWETLRYLGSGTACDWEYDGKGHAKCWGFTFEIDREFQPPAYQIPITCAEQYPVLIKLLKLGFSELPVNVTSFRAEGVEGGVALRWEVANERGLAGFNLYRRPVAPGPAVPDYLKLNRTLIAGRSPYNYVDRELEAGRDYEYLLEGVDLNGGTATFGPVRGRAPGKALAKAAALHQNRPNPARGATTITFELAAAGEASLEVYDCAGRKVRTLYAGHAGAGAHELSWDVTDEGGRPLAPGVYVYRLRAGGETLSRRMVAAR
ncbi:MAG: T9SS type A sorting domain-containing protein [candidate division Zixibacteria bacterium]|nr:T9SS type A sorting domain-containing protein [candidate division Zixibacteria bacterium]